MATRTITLEIDAYERLKAAKRQGESFSQVVRRAVFPDEPATGAGLLEIYRDRRRVSERYVESIAEAADNDLPPDDPWT